VRYKWDKKYLYWGITISVIIAFAITFYFLILRLPDIRNFFRPIIVACQPIFYGLIIAYLLNPIHEWATKHIGKFLNRKLKNKQKAKKLTNYFAVAVSIIFLIVCLFLILYLILPQLFVTLIGLIESVPTYINQLENWANDLLSSNPKLEESVLLILDNASDTFNDWSKTILPQLNTIIDNVTLGITNTVIFLKDFSIGIIVSIYLLSNKHQFINQTKKIVYSIFGSEKARNIIESGRFIDDLLGKTFKGMILGSVIIGASCFLGLVVLDIPYALLVSLIVGVTNMIPFFGPVIGAVPSFLLILLVSPIKSLYFLIFIFLLQQIEGNIIGPKLIGGSIGLPSFWVLFAILVFGSIWGILGMIVAGPLFAVIYHFVSVGINKMLQKKNLPTNTGAYANIDDIK